MKLVNYDIALAFAAICFGALVVDADNSTTEYTIPTEIKELFSDGNATKTIKYTSSPAGSHKALNNIYAEGSSIPVGEEHVTPGIKVENGTGRKPPDKINATRLDSADSDARGRVNASAVNHKAKTLLNESTSNLLQKLSEPRLNSLLDVDRFVHGSETSLVKPHEGVGHGNIVPRKGVNECGIGISSMNPDKGRNATKFESMDKDGGVENIANISLPLLHSCFVAEQNKCYNIGNYKDIECACCDTGNELGKLVSRQSLINCSMCSPVNKTPVNLSDTCKGICCKNISHEATSIVTAKPVREKSHGAVQVFANVTDATNRGNDTGEPATKKKMMMKSKPKPIVTHVPYNSDVSSNNPFSKTKGEKYVPIIVSIFILPLVGLSVFFVWKKTRELWDRRYYKRMDFLIDGMYND